MVINLLPILLVPFMCYLLKELLYMGETGTKFQNWWDVMAQKYQWESAKGGNWEINFDTCEIFLVKP